MIRIFIGYDRSESVAAYVLAHSISARASEPVSFTFLNRTQFNYFYSRERGPLDSTDFSLTRFLVPYLCDYKGFALFMDCDMLMRGDVAELWSHSLFNKAVSVVQHDYTPAKSKKFLGQAQTKYLRKNWTSVMLFDCSQCFVLTPQFVQRESGLNLQQLNWITDDKIGAIPKQWNYLVGEENQCAGNEAKLIHYTNGTPCFDEYANSEFADEWRAEFSAMSFHAN